MLSIFNKSGPKKPGSGPVVTKVMVKKPAPAPAGSNSATAASSSSSSSSKKPPAASESSSTKQSRPRQPPSSATNGKSKHSASRSAPAPIPPTPSKSALKRKASDYSRVESESESDEADAIDLLGTRTGEGKKRARISGSGTPLVGTDERVGLKRQLFRIEPDRVSWEGFVPGEDVVLGRRKGWTDDTEETKAKSLLDKYVAYFPQEGFEKQEPLPSVELQYPAKGCTERFYLLNPTASREYAPLRELRTAVQQILEFYIPPSHRHIFGSLSDSIDLDSPALSRMQSPAPAINGLHTPPPSVMSPPSTPGPSARGSETIGDAIRKALAPNRRDGPGLVAAIERFNTALREIQEDGSMARWLETRSKDVQAREWAKLVDTVHDQAYSRVVGPYSNELEHHPKHPDEVLRAISAKEDAYGELRHDFMTKVIEQTGLGPDSVFVDLGSGVGNCVTQVALQAGSRSYGFELLPVPAHCARLQVQETKKRWAMWCLAGNPEVEVHEGDFRTIPDVAKRLNEADVVLVNNEVFPSSLNIDLTNMFLDLKDGAKIVSLKPFVSEGFRMNDSNCDSFAAIVKLESHHYAQGWVSWKGDSGRYYIQTIDRTARIKYEQRMGGGGRSSRR